MFQSLRVLRSRQYALVWWPGLVSDTGTWMQSVAIGALVTTLTGSAAWGGLVAGATFLASGLITPFGGVVADRHNRRMILFSTYSVLAVVAVTLAALYAMDRVSPVVLVAVTTAEGVLLAFTIPARGALIPDLVGSGSVADAAALGNASWNLGRLIGPSLAGAVIAWGSYTLVFALNALTYVVVAVAMTFVRAPAAAPHTGTSTLTRLREGWQGARSDIGCWSVIRIVAITAFLVSPFIALMPAMAQLAFHGTAVDTAHFTMAQGVGSVVGAFSLSALVRRFGRRRAMCGLLVALPLSEMGYAVAPEKWMALCGAFLLGATYIAITIGTTVIIQLRSPSHLRGRVLALNFMVLSLFYPIGAFLQGRIADLGGVRQVLFIAPVLYLVVLGVIAVSRPVWFRSLEGPDDERESERKSVTGTIVPATVET